jgi:hypothetical protein
MNKRIKLILYSLVSIVIIVVIIAIIYYSNDKSKKAESFLVDPKQIAPINYFDSTSAGNFILTNNDYVSVMGEAYNKLILEDEAAIKDIYDDTIVNANIAKQLVSNDKKNKKTSKIFPPNSSIKTIKSKNNAQYLSLLSNDPTGKYSIIANDKCLTVSGTCKNNPYCLTDCQTNIYTSDSQKFYTTNIATESDAMNVMGSDIQINKRNIYPFNIFRSAVDDSCLSMSDNGLSLEQCNLNDIRHQWQISPDENICLLN